MERDNFSSRLGFILVSAGCAIGLGNVWRFPYIVGEYGGAAFVLVYLVCLFVLGFPIVVAEFAVGRGSKRSVAKSFDQLEPTGTKWHIYKYFAIAANMILMMFYTTVAGWMLYYIYKTAVGGFVGLGADDVGRVFGELLADPVTMTGYMVMSVVIGSVICYMGVRNGVERVTKVMMICLLILMVALAVNSVLLPGSEKGLEYYLYPDFSRLLDTDPDTVIFAAMGQAFFTLSVGIGALAIFGSYIEKSRRLSGEALWIILLDTFVALTAGLIIFPACFNYGVNPGGGPSLLFVTLPNIFNNMPLGRLWGSLFFLFMAFAAMSTVVAVFENIICSFRELLNVERRAVIRRGMVVMIILSMPCVLGFNVWRDFQPLGAGSGVLDLEDFLVSNNLLPLGSLVYLFFCTCRYGWGWDNFISEVNQGRGVKFPQWLRFYMTYILPLIVLYIIVRGYFALFVS